MNNRGIVVASFGSSYLEAKKKSFDAIEDLVKGEYKDYLVESSYSSGIVRGILKKRDGIESRTTEEQVDDMKARGIEDIAILSLYVIPGVEYEKSTGQGLPRTLTLLEEEEYYDDIMKALKIEDKEEVVILVGHGTYVEADSYYGNFQRYIYSKGFDNVYISSLEGANGLDDLLEKIKGKHNRVRLVPFLIVAGDHAQNDIFGEEDSYLSAFKENGIEVVEDRQGLGERRGIQEVFLKKLEALLSKMDEFEKIGGYF
ncbi:MAG: sirohydrochlorin cobaltochelatase [Tissierellia bacterium]|nr:sirohydrochlorin cobaltochelatase [Tissierellia bacterium]